MTARDALIETIYYIVIKVFSSKKNYGIIHVIIITLPNRFSVRHVDLDEPHIIYTFWLEVILIKLKIPLPLFRHILYISNSNL